jgi:hypothetical protein
MNATMMSLPQETSFAEISLPKRVSLSAVLPYAALVLTVAAFCAGAPVKLARVKSARQAHAAPPRTLAPTTGNYPVPSQPIWMSRPASQLPRFVLP